MKNSAKIVQLLLVLSASSVLCFGPLCEEGPCCEKGIFLSNATVCRPAANECDVPDYCSGFSSECSLDISVTEGTPCSQGEEFPGRCVDGFCFNSIVQTRVKVCEETCSKINGNCSQNGTCLCFEPWKNPPYCNTKVTYAINVNSTEELHREMQMIDNITSKRFRRSSGHKHHHQTHNNFQQQPVAMPLSVADPPKKDLWTRMTEHPVFGMVAIIVVAVLILIGIAIWAVVMYQMELRKKRMKERVKVRRRSSRKIPKDTSLITSPSVNIDIGN